MAAVMQRNGTPTHPRLLFCLVIDNGPRFAWQGFHLVHSIREHCAQWLTAIRVHTTPEVSGEVRALFAGLGCDVIEIMRTGDGKYCNKISQLDQLSQDGYELAVLLDTDTILTEDIGATLSADCLQAKPVDFPNPPLLVLREIAHQAGLKRLPPIQLTDAPQDHMTPRLFKLLTHLFSPASRYRQHTYSGNCNGGLYAIPRSQVPLIAREWRRWADWLLANPEPLRRAGKEMHTDQVAMWLAICHNDLPFMPLSSNFNLSVHMDYPHANLDERQPIRLIHYHDCMDVTGLITPAGPLPPNAAAAVAKANEQIGRHFSNPVFWDFRYRNFLERGSGIGSRGENAVYKRALLKSEGIEQAESVVDIGCGDLGVLCEFQLNNYSGFDSSPAAVAVASRARPDWRFAVLHNRRHEGVPVAEFVLCLEVAIHQPTRADYDNLVTLIASKTVSKLIVSGYDEPPPEAGRNPMIFFYEPLAESLQRTQRFRSIEAIGSHTGVKIYRCVV